MANNLKPEKQLAVVSALVEGMSVRSTERLTGVHRDTIIRFMLRLGAGCQRLMDRQLRNLNCRHVECDEIWAYVYKKQRAVRSTDDLSTVGDFYTFVALDRETKLIPAFRVGKRNTDTTLAFMDDLRSRLAGRVQLSTDAFTPYIYAVDAAFARKQIDYGQIVKYYEGDATAAPEGTARRYSPPRVVRTEVTPMWGNPDPAMICTSHVERSNLSMRMGMRRMTRLTNAFSKRVESLEAAVRVYVAHYNYVRIHKTLRVTPAMAANVTPNLWTMSDLLQSALNA